MPKRSKSKLGRIKSKHKHISKNKLFNPTPSHDEILTGTNRINHKHITSENTTATTTTTVLLNNPRESKTEMPLPAENRTTFKESPKPTIIRASDNATNIKKQSKVEIQKKSSTISNMDSSELNEISYKVLKLEDMINLWNDLSKIAVPQCRCANLKTKK